MHEIGAITRCDAAQFAIDFEKGGGIERGHAQSLGEIETEWANTIAHGLVHGQDRSCERSFRKFKAAIPGNDLAALELEARRSAGGRGQGVRDEEKRAGG